MRLGLRLVLIVGAILMLAFILNKIRKNQLRTSDAVFWFVLAGCFVVIAIFPQIVFWLSALIGVESPANLVFLIVVAILVIRLLLTSVEIAQLKIKLSNFVQHEALRESRREQPSSERSQHQTNACHNIYEND